MSERNHQKAEIAHNRQYGAGRSIRFVQWILAAVLLTLAVLRITPLSVHADDSMPPYQATEDVDLSKPASLAIRSSVAGTYKIWKIADMVDIGNGLVNFKLTDEIASKNVQVDLMNLGSSSTQQSAITLANLLNAGTSPVASFHLGASDQAQSVGTFAPGLYLVDCQADADSEMEMNPVLVAVPMIENHQWIYDVIIDATKFSKKREMSDFQVKKVWDDKESKDRPASVTIKITNKRTGESKTVTLNKDNNWTYSWKMEKSYSGTDWAVSEVDPPVGYKWSVVYDDTTGTGIYTVTNTIKPKESESETDKPKESESETDKPKESESETDKPKETEKPKQPNGGGGGYHTPKTGDSTPFMPLIITLIISAAVIVGIVAGMKRRKRR